MSGESRTVGWFKRLVILLIAFMMLAVTVLPGFAEKIQPESPLATPDTIPRDGNEQEGMPHLIRGNVTQADYVIGSGDSMHIEDLQMGVLAEKIQVLADGNINLPLVGKVPVAGLSVKEAKALLAERYAQFYVNPRLTLQMTNQRPVRVFVKGAVRSPGIYMSGKPTAPELANAQDFGSTNTRFFHYRFYLTDALLLSGGLNYNADVKDILIRRRFPEPTTIHVNLMELFQNNDIRQDLTLHDQDVVEVVELPADTLVMDADWETLAEQNIGLGAFDVNVTGSVSKPGIYRLHGKETVLSAIAEAGGFDQFADQSQVYVLRTLPNGQVVRRKLDLTDKMLLGQKSFSEWGRLWPNDLVYVEESGGKKALHATGNFVNRASSAALFPVFNRLFGEMDLFGRKN